MCNAQENALTFVHVPPKAAGNKRKAFRSVNDDTGMTRMDRGRDGGFGVYAHCDSCRADTSPWDDEYITWSEVMVTAMRKSQAVGTRNRLQGKLKTARPGRFARSAIAGMTAIAEGLIDTHPELVQAVRTGGPLAMDTTMRFLVGVTEAATQPIIEGGHRGIVVSVDGVTGSSTQRPTLSALVHFPPFSLILADTQVAGDLPHTDCTDWLKIDANEVRADFPIDLPVIRIQGNRALEGERLEQRLTADIGAFVPGIV